MTIKAQCVAAGVSASDLARLLGITRVSVHYWFSGRNQPDKNLAPKVEKLLRAMTAAVAAGDLPLKTRYRGAIERTRNIGMMIVKHHKKYT